MTKLENVNPLLTNRDDRDVFFEEASSCRKVQRYRVLWSAQLEIAQPQSCCFAIHQLKPLFLQAILYDVYCYAKDSAVDTKGYPRSNIMTQDGCFACLTCNMRNEKENHCEGVHWDGCVLIE